MQKNTFVSRALKSGGLALLVFGMAVACEEEKSSPQVAPADPNTNTGDDAGNDGPDAGPDAEPPDEVRKGERGSSCDSTNDCQDGLSCIVTNDCPYGVACANKSCQPSNFEIMGTGKQCHVTECTGTADCCGDMPLEAPAKCEKRESICNTPTLPGCVFAYCTEDAECGTGTCEGSCYWDDEKCLTTTDCALNECVPGAEPDTDTCSLSLTDCAVSGVCSTNTCSTPICNCENPEYDPLDPICSDEDCEGICPYVCDQELCTVDLGCDLDADCALTTPFCDAGKCVECLTSDDCEDEECVNGRCGPECEQDTQCSLFETCQSNACVYVGCQSDRECVLSAGGDAAKDPRLATCNIEDGIGTCVFPCEIDAQCAPTEVCLDGVCEYIGCETDGECKTILGLHNQPTSSDDRPWTTTAVCREDTSP